MKRTAILLSLVAAAFVLGGYAQEEQKPAAKAAQSEFPKKPEKDPETAEEYYQAARWEWVNAPERSKAFDYIAKAIELDPMHIDAYYLRANLRSAAGGCKEAMADYDFVIANFPDSYNAYQTRGECRVKLKDYQGALSDMNLAVAKLEERKLIQVLAYVNRGNVRYIVGDHEGAIQDFTVAASRNVSVGPIFRRAMTYLKKGDKDKAIADLAWMSAYHQKISGEVRKKFPDQYKEPDGYPPGEDPFYVPSKVKNGKETTEYSIVARTAGAAVSACSGCKQREFANFADKIVPDNWFFPSEKIYLDDFLSGDMDVAYFLLGRLQTEKGQLREAVTSFTEGIISRSIESSPLYMERGRANFKLGEYDRAVRDLSRAIFHDRGDPAARLERGLALLVLGHDELAKKDFDKFLERSTPEGKEYLKKRRTETIKLRQAQKGTK